MNNTQIRSIDHLKNIATEGIECFILLNGGLRSSKHIFYRDEDKSFVIINYIDDSTIILTEDELMDNNKTLIGEAIKLNSLYLD